MTRIALPDVMLCAVTGVEQDRTIAALRESMRLIDFGDAVLLSQTRPEMLDTEVFRWEQIEPLKSKEAYSIFICTRLASFCTRRHVLLIQWDGFVIDPQSWDDQFLQYDYVGAPWPQFESILSVGNGGFSLRSKRLMEAVAARNEPGHPEDLKICHDWRADLEMNHGISFASCEMAARFARERHLGGGPTFGFHGLFLFPSVLPASHIKSQLYTLEPDLLAGRDGHDLLIELIQTGRLGLALRLLLRRMAKFGLSIDDLSILLRFLAAPIWRGRPRLNVKLPEIEGDWN